MRSPRECQALRTIWKKRATDYLWHYIFLTEWHSIIHAKTKRKCNYEKEKRDNISNIDTANVMPIILKISGPSKDI